MFLTDFHMQKYTGGIISWVGIFLTVTLANQVPSPHETTQELMQIFGKGRGQAHREELHGN